jgi:hypothetical protein
MEKVIWNVTNWEKDLTTDKEICEGVQNFTYLGTLMSSKNVISEETNPRTAAGSRCFYRLGKIFRYRATNE